MVFTRPRNPDCGPVWPHTPVVYSIYDWRKDSSQSATSGPLREERGVPSSTLSMPKTQETVTGSLTLSEYSPTAHYAHT